MSRRIALASLLGVITGLPATSAAQDCSGTTFLVSAVAVTGLAVFDIATAPASARRHNRRNAVVVPRIDLRNRSYGLSVSLSVSGTAPARAMSVAPVRRSPGTAFALSLGATATPMLAGVAAGDGTGAYLFLGGLIIGPSVGQVYAGSAGRGLGTAALRGAGTVIGLASIVDCFTD